MANPNGNWTRVRDNNGNVLWLATTDIVATDGLLEAANNLSDLANASTARTNLGLGTIATLTKTPSAGLSGDWPASTIDPSISRSTNTPGANIDNNNASYADVFTIDSSVTIPSWATACDLIWSMTNIQWVTAATVCSFRIVLDSATGQNDAVHIGGDPAENDHHHACATDHLTGFATGSGKTLKIQGIRNSGTGAARLNTASVCSAVMIWT